VAISFGFAKDRAVLAFEVDPSEASVSRGTEGLQTRRWREMDSNCYYHGTKARDFRAPGTDCGADSLNRRHR
jgi:hypothetical protein